MKIKVLEPNGFEVLSLHFPLLDIDIPQRRKVIIRSIAYRHGFLTSSVIRKDANGVGYVEVKMLPDTDVKKISLFAKEAVKELL